MTQATDAGGGGDDAQDSDELEYSFLIPGHRLHVDIGIGNGHTAEIRASSGNLKWGPATDRLVFETEPNDIVSGTFLSVVADVSPGLQVPPPQALLTVTIYQVDPKKPTVHEDEQSFDVKREFGASNVLRVDFTISLD